MKATETTKRESGPALRRWEWLLLLAGLLLFVGQAALSSPQKSAAFDEEYHLARGYAYLRTGDFRLSRPHPPLLNLLSAVPLLARDDVVLPLDHPAWESSDFFTFGDVFLWQANDNPQELLELGRLSIITLGAALALALFFWARQLGGAPAAWTALLLATFDPNLLANSRLVTTDLGLTLFFFVAVWRFWRWLEQPTRSNLIWAGLAAGLTMTSKFTGLMVWPSFLVVLLLHPVSARWRWRGVPALAGMGAVAYLALWAVYRFDVGPLTLPGLDVSLPVLAPYYPYTLLETFIGIEEQPKTAYLLGQTSPRGWWYYFPVALAVKTPLPTLLLAGGGLATMLGVHPTLREGVRRLAALWAPPALFLALSMTARITIGYRHILPVVPFLILLAACGVGRGWAQIRQSTPLRVALLALLLWQTVGVVRLFPHHEAYFNELAGGPENGDRVLVDSNLDWGQDLPALRELMERRGIETVNLAYFGTALPEAYGINYRPLPGFLRFLAGPEIQAYNPYTPAPGWYAISRSSLRLGMMYQNVDIYAYFRDKEPVARAGYSINLYEVAYPPDTPITRAVVTGDAVSDLSPQELGLQPRERLVAKWTASPDTTIVPAGQEVGLPAGFRAVDADFAGAFTLWGYEVQPAQVAPGEP
ncbi:MAG: ArnT family glycosyltransferase, partial [Chloroflexota bacterium]